ncbi:hypothetical protein [Streptomyces sp. MS2.AVA.5]|uniref:Uncharacterized protein n=1 Tax=Streptomyces achmelvichensis TaxID=3134111 RepID=A0ACC6PME5_9ACTN
MLTINVAVLLAVIVFVRLRRRTEARSRLDEKVTVILVLSLGVLLAPTPAGEWIAGVLGQLAGEITQASKE